MGGAPASAVYSDYAAVWICLIYIPSVKTVHIKSRKLKVVRDTYMYCCWPFLLMWPSGNYCCADVSSYNVTGQNNAVLICLVSGKGLWKQWWPHRQEGTLIDEGMLGGKVGLWLGYVQHKGGCLIRKEVKRQKAGNRLLKNEQLKSVFKKEHCVRHWRKNGTEDKERKEGTASMKVTQVWNATSFHVSRSVVQTDAGHRPALSGRFTLTWTRFKYALHILNPSNFFQIIIHIAPIFLHIWYFIV